MSCRTVWNVTAEAGKKTLVWHWPGSAWPPSSESPNLTVVDGTSPGGVNMSSAQVDGEFIVMASEKNDVIEYRSGAMTDAKVPCVVTGLGDDKPKKKGGGMASLMQRKMDDGFRLYIVNLEQDGQGGSVKSQLTSHSLPLSQLKNGLLKCQKAQKNL